MNEGQKRLIWIVVSFMVLMLSLPYCVAALEGI